MLDDKPLVRTSSSGSSSSVPSTRFLTHDHVMSSAGSASTLHFMDAVEPRAAPCVLSLPAPAHTGASVASVREGERHDKGGSSVIALRCCYSFVVESFLRIYELL